MAVERLGIIDIGRAGVTPGESSRVARHNSTRGRRCDARTAVTRAVRSANASSACMLADVEPARAAYVAVEALVKRGGVFGAEVLSGAMDGRGGAETTRSDRATREAQVKALFTALATARAVKHDSEAVEVTKGVFLGSVGAAKNRDRLRALGVTHVLTVCEGLPRGGFYPDDFTHATCAVRDAPDADISAHFDFCFDFIRDALARGGGVLVHCFQGKSRSATICAMYMMRALGMSYDEAISTIRAARPTAAPNSGFERALRRLDDGRREASASESPTKKARASP